MEPSLDIDSLQRTVDALRVQQDSVRRERDEVEAMKATVDGNLKRFKQRVKLNVGGSKFETTLSTLTGQPGSMLAAMFSGRHEVPQDEDGYVFIDRDGTHFRTILNFLRSGVLHVPSSHRAAEELKCELLYYQLPIESLSTRTGEAEPPVVDTVVTEPLQFQGSGAIRYLEVDVEAHSKTIQERLLANPQLRIIAYNILKCDNGFKLVTTLATQHARLPTALHDDGQHDGNCLLM